MKNRYWVYDGMIFSWFVLFRFGVLQIDFGFVGSYCEVVRFCRSR